MNSATTDISYLVFMACLAFLFLPRTALASTASCTECHQIALDTNHQMDCTACHRGNPVAEDQENAHHNLITRPSHPDNDTIGCSACHPTQSDRFSSSAHLTLKNLVNTVRHSFGAQKDLDSMTAIPVISKPSTVPELVDDMLRRRCLRCHLYYGGDSYPSTGHGTGCAACHLKYKNNTLQSHSFVKLPGDDICLSCHYGNTVGSDYYGRYEQDYSWDYRTPFVWSGDKRPYGVETHSLTPDIHQQKGLSCIDCHVGSDKNGSGVHSGSFATISCRACHQAETMNPPDLPAHISRKDKKVTMTGRLNNRHYTVPQLKHPAHADPSIKADCLVCHAMWSFNDKGTNLMRLDRIDPDKWFSLSVQGSSEVENLIDNGEELPRMTDKINGEAKSGIWLQGFETRRWETVFIGLDKGILKVMRPLMDIHLSYRDIDGNVIVDGEGIGKDSPVYRPYTPHTVGKAGIFYRRRLKNQLPAEDY